MTMHTSSRAFRGVASARADGADANKILANLQKAFEDFKAENDIKLKAKADVVIDEKVERINKAVGDMQAALDDANARLAAVSINGAGQPRRAADPEYTSAFLAHMRRGDVNAALTKATPADGGFTAPTEWDRTVTDRLVIVSPMRQICSVQTISVNAFTKLFNNKGTTSGWVGETAARTETATPTFGSLTYTTGELYANPSASQQMLDDSLVDLEAWLAGEVEQEFALQEGTAFVNGTGVNRPNGITTYITGGTNAAAHPYGAILTVNSGIAAAIGADSILNLIHALPSAFTPNARFAMNRDTHRQVRLLKDTTNQYLWQPSYQAGQPATLAGYPITEMAALPNVAASARPILFGDFARSYLIVDRAGLRLLRDPFTNKPNVMFYTTKRVGGGLLNPEPMRALNIAV
jgi:HK97 family phage major capsid protein